MERSKEFDGDEFDMYVEGEGEEVEVEEEESD